MKVYNKFVESKNEPQNKNDIWFDGSSWKMYKEGMWRSFTLPLNTAVEINKILQEDKSVLQQELKNYLKIQDSPFEKGSAENSTVLKGGNNQATNINEASFGKYNNSNSGTQFSVGIGTSDADRRNAHEITSDGKNYIIGIGGYDGTNPDDANDVTTVINNKAEKTDIVQSDWIQNDKNDKDFIKGRTHYLYFGDKSRIDLTTADNVGDYSYIYDDLLDWDLEEVGLALVDDNGSYIYKRMTYELQTIGIVSDVTIKAKFTKDYHLVVYISSPGMSIHLDSIKLYLIYNDETIIKELDEIFIPDTIARTNDVDELREETTALWENLDHGTFPNLVSGDLAGRGESVPAEFGFRASGGKSIKDGRAYIKSIKGNSVVWNQNMENVLSGSTSVRAWIPRRGLDYASIENGEITLRFDSQSDAFGNSIRQRINVKAGDKFFISYDYESHNVDQFGRRMFIAFTSGWSSRGGLNDNCSAKGGDVTGHVEAIEVVPSRDDIDSICFYFCYTGITSPDTTPLKVSKFRFVNLTKMFGAEEAAKINTIEDYNARKPFVEDEYAYNEGQVIHCNTESIKSVGDNAWDEQWEVGTINITTGENSSNASNIRAINYIDIIGGAKYYCTNTGTDASNKYYVWALFYDQEKKLILNPYGRGQNYEAFNNKTLQLPSNARYMRFYLSSATTYNHDIMISLVHSGWKQDTDAGYQPYWQDTLPLPIIRNYFPDGMKSAGSAHDEIRFNKSSGKWEAVQRIGTFDKWEGRTISNADNPNLYAFPSGMLAGAATPKAGEVICIHEKYEGRSQNTLNATESNGIAVYTSNRLWIKDMDVTSDPEALITKLSGTKLYYQLAKPIVTELDAEDQNFRDYYNVADFGTEEAIPATDAEGNIIPSANFSADIIYQFNAVDMIREHEIEITELQKVIATMQAQLASLTSNS